MMLRPCKEAVTKVIRRSASELQYSNAARQGQHIYKHGVVNCSIVVAHTYLAQTHGESKTTQQSAVCFDEATEQLLQLSSSHILHSS